MYKHPGVYVEHIPSGLLAIEAASTSTALFIGHIDRGPLNEPVFITSRDGYAARFAPPGSAGGIVNLEDKPDTFGHAITAFFANGGSKAYVMRLGAVGAGVPAGTAASAELESPIGGGGSLKITASDPGKWGESLVVQLAAIDMANAQFGHTLRVGTLKTGGSLDKETDLEILESFSPVSLDKDAASFAGSVVNGTSQFIKVDAGDAPEPEDPDADAPEDGEAPAPGFTAKQLENGVDVGNKHDYGAAFTKLRDYRDISIIVLPGVVYDNDGKATVQAALSHVEFMKNGMVIVDPPEKTLLDTPMAVSSLGLDASPYAALYYPWLTVTNPHYDKDLAPGRPKTFAIAPSGFAAGLWARIDASRGVWKAPAGLEASVRGTQGPIRLIGNDIQDNLNDLGVNCIRAVIGPTVIWGARTLATRTKPEFRYIPVRRTQSMIGESLYAALQAVVFEPNDHKLWSSLRGSVGDFMDGLFRAGAFQGEKASDAYFVRCGLGPTMTQADIDAGIVRVVVGFAPLKPAEFVVVQIQQIVGQRG